MPQLNARRTWAFAAFGVALAAAVATVWWRGGQASPAPVDGTASRTTTPATPPASQPVGESEPAPGVADAGGPAVSLDDLWHLCPNPWSGIGEECAAALDGRYLREAVGLAQLHDNPIRWERRSKSAAFGGVVWEDVFADPEATREAALAALRREECRVAQGETRRDLGETCAADEVAKLAMLQEACVMPLVLHSGFNPWRPPGEVQTWFGPSDAELDERWTWWVDRLDEDASLPLDEYWRRRAEIDDARFRFAWRLMRCEAVPETALAWLDVLPTPTAEPEDQNQGTHLTVIASRLGSEWARREIEQAEQTARENLQRRLQALIDKVRNDD